MSSYVVYCCVWLLSFLPLSILYGVSDILYYLFYYVARYRRSVVKTNLTNAFPEKSVQERREIERRYYRHLCDVFVELYRFWHIPEREIRKRCVFKNPELLQKHFDAGKGVVGVLGHYCNWEWMSSYALYLHDIDFYPLYKPVHDKVLDGMTYRIRSHFGAKPIPKKKILRKIVENKNAGKPFLAAFIADQTPSRNNLHYWTDFLNQDTPVFLGTEKIAMKFNLPVISLNIRKVKRGYYEVEFMDLCEEPARLRPGELTEMHTRLLESYIKAVPEYWLWSHRRWKYKREDQDVNQKNTDE